MAMLKNRPLLRVLVALILTTGFAVATNAAMPPPNCAVAEGCDAGCWIAAINCPSCVENSNCTITWDSQDHEQCSLGFLCHHSCPVCEVFEN